MHLLRVRTLIPILCAIFQAVGACQEPLQLIPWPLGVGEESGTARLSVKSQITVEQEELLPLAEVVAEEIYRVSGLRIRTSSGVPAGAGIHLKLSDSLSAEAYRLRIEEAATVVGRDYRAVAMGTATLLQLLRTSEADQISLPRLEISDEPFSGYRGLMVDVGLRWCPPESLKPVIDLCRLYKINYLGLHHNNDQVDGMLTGSSANMTHAEKVRRNHSYYTREQMEEMIAYARVRGVTMVPFASPFIDKKSYPSIFENFEQKDRFLQDCPEFWEAMDKKIELLCDLYKESPYIHLGAMAGEAARLGNNEIEREFMQKNGIRDSNEYYIWLTERIRESVVKHGKTAMIWEGVRPSDSEIPLSKDVIICGYSMHYYRPMEIVRDGYPLINCSWLPLYSVQAQNNYSPRAETIYDWSLGEFQHREPNATSYEIPRDAEVLKGSQLCIWEETYESVMPDLRMRAPAFAERTWNPDAGKTFEDFVNRRKATDELLQRIAFPVQIESDNAYLDGDPQFTDSATIACRTTLPGTVRYDIAENWGSFPTAESPEYKKPLEITDDAVVTFQLFDRDSRPIGSAVQEYFSKIDPVLDYTAYGYPPYGGWISMPDLTTLDVIKSGTFGRMNNKRYVQIARRTFTPPEREAHIDVRPHGLYNNFALELEGQIAIPTPGAYTIRLRTRDGLGSLEIGGQEIAVRNSFSGPATEFRGELPEGTFPIRLKYFARQIYSDLNLRYKGPGMTSFEPMENLLVSKPHWKSGSTLDSLPEGSEFVDQAKVANRHLALDKPVTASGEPQGGHLPRNAVDGNLTNESGWHVGTSPAWLRVDLGETVKIDRLRVVTYFDKSRHYQYTVDISTDGENWEPVVDMSKNTEPAAAHGYGHSFPEVEARFVRITMLKNSANRALHLNELMVFANDPAERRLYGKLVHSATGRLASGVALRLEKNGQTVAKATTGSDGTFLLSTDASGPFLLNSPENNGMIDGELIGVSQEIADFKGIESVEIISDVEKVGP